MNSRISKAKNAGIVLLAALLLFSATVVTATPTLTTRYHCTTPSNTHHPQGEYLWDNGNATTNALSSQLDTQYPFNSQVADDFEFSTAYSFSELICYGLFWGGSAINPIDLNVLFYADDGSGNMPTGAGLPDPTSTALQVELHTAVMGWDNGDGTYTYYISLRTPFLAQANTKYWVAFQWVGTFPPQWGWCVSDAHHLHDCMQGFPMIGYPYWTDAGCDVAFQFSGFPPPPQPDLDGKGALAWSDVTPGATVNGSFQVGNVGDNWSVLGWLVTSWPGWGNWTFSPSAGTIEAGDWTTVAVSVVAPPDKQTAFNGTIRVVNTYNASDYCDIPVTLATPLNQGMHHHSFFERFFARFPHAFPILRSLLR